jgi:diamine N-acetyltransferase
MSPGGSASAALINLEGEKVALGPLRRELVAAYTRWINEVPGVFTLSGRLDPVSLTQREAYYVRVSRDLETSQFTIYERATLRPIGMTWLFPTDPLHRCGFIGIDIGEPECRGRGYGTEAIRLMLEYGFHALSLELIELTVVASNVAGIRAYERAGFKIVGTRRQAVRVGIRVEDFLHLACHASAFQPSVLTFE